MIQVALVLAGTALAVASVALLVGIRAYDVAVHLQALNQSPQPVTGREPVRLHVAARPALRNFDAVRGHRQWTAHMQTHPIEPTESLPAAAVGIRHRS